ncbi:MAG: hypothetical protein U0744_00175 [Gemmataceae bacterium]
MSQSSRSRFAPFVENLAERLVPTVSAKVDVILGVPQITIRGDAGGNNVQIFDQGHGGDNAIKVVAGGVTTFFSGSIEDISIDLDDGNDKLTYTLVGDLTVNRDVFSLMGSGNDIFKGVYQANIGNVTHHLATFGENGNDAASIDAIGANFSAGSNLGGIDIAAGADVSWNLSDGFGVNAGYFSDDSYIILYNGELDGDLSVKIDTGSGDDFLRMQAEIDSGSTGNLTAKMNAGAGGDFIDARVRKNTGASAADVYVDVDGGLGIDDGTFDVAGTLVKKQV